MLNKAFTARSKGLKETRKKKKKIQKVYAPERIVSLQAPYKSLVLMILIFILRSLYFVRHIFSVTIVNPYCVYMCCLGLFSRGSSECKR